MERLHDLLSDAVDRAAHAQEESRALVERQVELVTALEETVEQVRRRRRSETDSAVRGGGCGRGRPRQR